MIHLFTFHLTFFQVAVVLMVALLIGMAKTGVHGAGMLAVPLLATVFGGQLSSGIMLPLLLMADLIGVWYYHRHASWHHLKILFPWAALGVLAGTLTGSYINDQLFKILMAIIIVMGVIIMIWLERATRSDKIPQNKVFGATAGVAGGFTSMVGNLAGPVMSVYLLSMRLPKNAFIGTTAWFFMVVNWFKVPFHIFVWKTMSWNTWWFDLLTFPLIVLGAWLGVVIVKSLSETFYRWFIIVMTLLAAFAMFL
jgi:uncharacterized membrane protein YfcA